MIAEDNPCATPFWLRWHLLPFLNISTNTKQVQSFMLYNFECVICLSNCRFNVTTTFVTFTWEHRLQQGFFLPGNYFSKALLYISTACLSITGPTWLFSSNGFLCVIVCMLKQSLLLLYQILSWMIMCRGTTLSSSSYRSKNSTNNSHFISASGVTIIALFPPNSNNDLPKRPATVCAYNFSHE
jgi:hypothetical protein